MEWLDWLGPLVDNCLLRQEEVEQPRFTILETAREYVREHLAPRGELEIARQQRQGRWSCNCRGSWGGWGNWTGSRATSQRHYAGGSNGVYATG